MKIGRIFHLEDEPEWVKHVNDLLGADYDICTATNLDEACKLFYQWAAEGMRFDVAIIDISLIRGDAHDKQGFKFIQALEETGIMRGRSIIVLSGHIAVDQNLRVAFRDYDVADVFDKGKFVDERKRLRKTVDDVIARLVG